MFAALPAVLLLLACSEDKQSADKQSAAPAISSVLQFEGGSSGDAPRNVLMISVDTLRRDSLGYYAGEDRDTPTFDRLLTDGVSLDKHRSCSNWTGPSVVCAVTGQYNVDAGFLPVTGFGERIPEGLTLISSALRGEGYRTGLVSTNPHLGVPTGYDVYFDETFQGEAGDIGGEDIIAQGLDYIAQFEAAERPWLIHLHFLEPHTPYKPPSEYVEGDEVVLGYDLRLPVDVEGAELAFTDMSEADQALMKDYAERMYAAEVRYMDDLLEALLDEVDAAGALEDTLVVLWSDHGEQLWDRDHLTHGKYLHSEETDAVAVFWAETLTPASVTLRTTHRDLMPTLLGGLNIPDERTDIGRSLSSESVEEPTFAARLLQVKSKQSVDDGELRMLYEWSGIVEVYYLDEDPDERVNRFDPTDPEQYALWLLLLPEISRLNEFYDDPVEPTLPAWDVEEGVW